MRKFFSGMIPCVLAFGVMAETEIVVTGQGVVSVMPEDASLAFSVRVEDTSPSTAINAASTHYNQAVEALKSKNIAPENIATEVVLLQYLPSVKPLKSLDSQAEHKIVPTASISLTLKHVGLDQIGNMISLGIESGLNEFNGISYTHSGLAAFEDEALDLAVKDAYHQAQLVAGASGMKLAGLKSLNVDGAAAPLMESKMLFANRMSAEGIAPVNLAPSDIVIHRSVSAVFELLPAG